MTSHTPPVALVTGASRGLGLAVTEGLVHRGWHVVADARDGAALQASLQPLGDSVTALPGDVGDAGHRSALAAAVDRLGRLDLLVHNAGGLGATPLPLLADYPLAELRAVFETTVAAPLALTQLLLAQLRAARGSVWAISSDAAREAYPGWGGYGAVKAALDQLVHVWSAEEQDIRWLAVDPGDLRTRLHQEAFPGEDISDRPLPASVVPALLTLLLAPSGRYRAGELVAS